MKNEVLKKKESIVYDRIKDVLSYITLIRKKTQQNPATHEVQSSRLGIWFAT